MGAAHLTGRLRGPRFLTIICNRSRPQQAMRVADESRTSAAARPNACPGGWIILCQRLGDIRRLPVRRAAVQDLRNARSSRRLRMDTNAKAETLPDLQLDPPAVPSGAGVRAPAAAPGRAGINLLLTV